MFVIAVCLLFFLGPAQSVDQVQETDETGATIFAPGVISTGRDLAISFSPDSSVIYFNRRIEELERDPGKTGTIFWSARDGDEWSKPEMTSYSGVYSTVDPAISPDGSKLYIMTTRSPEGGEAQKKPDIWMMYREGPGFDPGSWSDLVHLGPEVNLPGSREGASSCAGLGSSGFALSDTLFLPAFSMISGHTTSLGYAFRTLSCMGAF